MFYFIIIIIIIIGVVVKSVFVFRINIPRASYRNGTKCIKYTVRKLHLRENINNIKNTK